MNRHLTVFRLFAALAVTLFLLISNPALAGGSGAIWTTNGACGEEGQDANHFKAGDEVYVNGSNFEPGTYAWAITGNPGGSSCDPGIVVASGSVTVDASGAFCFSAYTIRDDDCGEYRYTVGGKNDNYRVKGEVHLEFGKIDLKAGWEETIRWSITKSAHPDKVMVCTGEEAAVCYTITLEKQVTSAPAVISGSVTLKSTGAEDPEDFSLTITLKKGGSQVDQTVITTLAANGIYPFSFTLAAPQPGSYTVEFAAEVSNGEGASGSTSVTLTKTTNGPATVQVTDKEKSWSFSGSGTVKYDTTFGCEDAGIQCNTATIVETGQSATAEVKVICLEKKRKPLGLKTECIDPYVYRPTLRVHFIVTNPNPVPVEVPFGLANTLEPARYQGSQPTLFAPGETEFEIEIANFETLQWLLDGTLASASRRTSVCTYASQDDVYIAGVGVFIDTNTNGRFDAGETLLTPDSAGKIGEVYLVNAAGQVVDSKVLGPSLFFRAGREVNFNLRQVWGEYYLVPQLSVPLPAGYRIYPNYRVVHTNEFPEPFYSLDNDFGLVPAGFIPDPAANLDLPRMTAVADLLDHPVKPGVAKTAAASTAIAAAPGSFALEQNYPNPFNPQTTIRYALPVQGHVTLTIYDMSGAVVTRLVDGEQTAGNYSQVWNAAGNPSGLYFCELRTASFREMRRMLLVK